jgi:cytochrome c biogenesis protein CcmG, thiol:disulfide interchange protein DsbE
MNRSILILILVSLPIAGFSQTTLPDIVIKSPDGEEMKLSDFATLKKPLVISFWATYCNPCLLEFKAISEQYKSWKKEVDFEFIAVSIDDSKSSGKVKSLVYAGNWPFIILIDENQEVKNAMNVSDIPFYYIFDRNGKFVFKHSGYLPGDESLMLKELKNSN